MKGSADESESLCIYVIYVYIYIYLSFFFFRYYRDKTPRTFTENRNMGMYLKKKNTVVMFRIGVML